MKLRVRVPWWARKEMEVQVNGSAAGTGKPGSYLELDRAWSSGDTVTFTLPAGFSLTEYTGEDQIPGKKRYSLMHGPLLYAAVGSADVSLRCGAHDLIGRLKPKAGSPRHYTVEGNPGVVYMPYWQVDEEEFTCFPLVGA